MKSITVKALLDYTTNNAPPTQTGYFCSPPTSSIADIENQGRSSQASNKSIHRMTLTRRAGQKAASTSVFFTHRRFM